MHGQIILLSGWRGVGKTTLCQHLAFAARRANWDVAGLISPADYAAGEKSGILAQDLRTGARRSLAHPPQPGEDNHGSLTPAWVFDPQQLAWGNDVLRDAIPCDLLVIDELGPLELLSDQGWQAGVAAVDSRRYRLALVVVRPELLAAACGRWPQAKLIVLESVADITPVSAAIAQQYFSLPRQKESGPEDR